MRWERWPPIKAGQLEIDAAGGSGNCRECVPRKEVKGGKGADTVTCVGDWLRASPGEYWPAVAEPG